MVLVVRFDAFTACRRFSGDSQETETLTGMLLEQSSQLRLQRRVERHERAIRPAGLPEDPGRQ
jgi:hypothetical protein